MTRANVAILPSISPCPTFCLPRLPPLPVTCQDGYGNYVIQSALSVTSGTTHGLLVEAIKPYLPTLRGTPHGKRIVQRINGKV